MPLTYNDRLADEFKKEVLALIDDKKEHLSRGGGISDIEKYRQAVGFIEGLREAIDLCDVVQKKINER